MSAGSMMWHAAGGLAAAALGWMAGFASSDPTPSPQDGGATVNEAAAFPWDTLLQQRAALGRPWLEFLRTEGLYAGAYVLAAGATDAQQPHREDEVYFVVRGRARFTAGSGAGARDFEAVPGQVLFVAAGVPHRFHSIEEELEVLVFFTTRQGPATRAEIDGLLRRYQQAYNAHDAKALAEVYTEDGIFQSPRGEVVRGRNALADYWSGRMGSNLVLTPDAFDSDGHAGFAAGTWQLDATDGGRHGGRFAVGLRRGPDGVWRMSFDTYHDAPE